MRPSHRLDVLAVPASPDHAPADALRRFVTDLLHEGVIDARGGPGPQYARWMPEGFRGLRLDIPDRITLYANRQGGFRVVCPVTGELVTEAFSRAYTLARTEPRPDLGRLTCPSCGDVHTLAETVGRPAFRFAGVALQTIDAEALRPSPPMVARLTEILGDLAWVAVRT